MRSYFFLCIPYVVIKAAEKIWGAKSQRREKQFILLTTVLAMDLN